MHITRVWLALTLAACATAGSAQPIYKWVDSQGVTQYTAHPPPPGTPVSVIVPAVSPAADAVSQARGQGDQLLEQAANAEAEREKLRTRPPAATQARQAEQRQQQCADERRQLDALTRGGPVFKYDDRGRRTYLADDQRDAEIARTQQAVRLACGQTAKQALETSEPPATASRLVQQCNAAREALRGLEDPQARSAPSDIAQARDLVASRCARMP